MGPWLQSMSMRIHYIVHDDSEYGRAVSQLVSGLIGSHFRVNSCLFLQTLTRKCCLTNLNNVNRITGQWAQFTALSRTLTTGVSLQQLIVSKMHRSTEEKTRWMDWWMYATAAPESWQIDSDSSQIYWHAVDRVNGTGRTKLENFLLITLFLQIFEVLKIVPLVFSI